MNLDGNNLVKLAKCSLFYAQPFEMWSADGQKLAFIDPETEPGKTWLCVVDANGNNRRQFDNEQLRLFNGAGRQENCHVS